MQLFGKARMEMKVGLTFACMNLKKLAKIKAKRGLIETKNPHTFSAFGHKTLHKRKMALEHMPQSRFVYSL